MTAQAKRPVSIYKGAMVFAVPSPNRQIELQRRIPAGMEAEMPIKSRRSVIFRVDHNTSTPDGLGRATCPIHGIRQEEPTEPLSLKIRTSRQPTKAGDGDLARVTLRQCGRQGFDNDKRRGKGIKAEDAGRMDILVPATAPGSQDLVVKRNRDKGPGNTLALMLKCGSVEPMIEDGDATIKCISVVVPSQGFQSDHCGGSRSLEERLSGSCRAGRVHRAPARKPRRHARSTG